MMALEPIGASAVRSTFAALASATLLLAGCGSLPGGSVTAPDDDVTPTTARLQVQVRQAYDIADRQSFDDARRGLIARPTGTVNSASGAVLWDYEAFKFEAGQAPASVNPSLWRQALLNNQIGLFKVVDGIYQLRGFDLANITLIEGRTGWIVVDTLTSSETAAAAKAFARQPTSENVLVSGPPRAWSTPGWARR
jgi:alkyl sulfatase BDS1-like metallo-beta-lactamase superfamily hydrolase